VEECGRGIGSVEEASKKGGNGLLGLPKIIAVEVKKAARLFLRRKGQKRKELRDGGRKKSEERKGRRVLGSKT